MHNSWSDGDALNKPILRKCKKEENVGGGITMGKEEEVEGLGNEKYYLSCVRSHLETDRSVGLRKHHDGCG